jgi:hypothetical protein
MIHDAGTQAPRYPCLVAFVTLSKITSTHCGTLRTSSGRLEEVAHEGCLLRRHNISAENTRAAARANLSPRFVVGSLLVDLEEIAAAEVAVVVQSSPPIKKTGILGLP